MSDKKGIKCILLGNTAVGKTSFITASNELSIDEVTSSVGTGYILFELEGTNIDLQIYDTAGQEQFRSLTKPYYRGIQMAIFITTCDNKTQKADDESLNEFISAANEFAGCSFRSVFLLNKIDLYKDNKELLDKRIEAVKTLLDSRTDIEGQYQLNPICCKSRDGFSDAWTVIKTIAQEIAETMTETPEESVIDLDDKSQQNNKNNIKDKCSC